MKPSVRVSVPGLCIAALGVEVYVWQDGAWKLGSLSFTRLLER